MMNPLYHRFDLGAQIIMVLAALVVLWALYEVGKPARLDRSIQEIRLEVLGPAGKVRSNATP